MDTNFQEIGNPDEICPSNGTKVKRTYTYENQSFTPAQAFTGFLDTREVIVHHGEPLACHLMVICS